ncbi:Protein transport protein sec16 [Heracleum sosnowskyi]|uniref:Protein transport protein sec16 n=1 Tax=Heracleum sosnowskyi TaxID=360622 RepID=A0AAD8MQI5_9APIA|nr:Protein transport protein sec16 [Heracleum sosnowskyi]
MASSPPFGMEDQTDEDFFDKLVDDDDDDFNVVSSSKSVLELGSKVGDKIKNESDLDEAKLKTKAFGNLNLGEGVGKTTFEVSTMLEEECKREDRSGLVSSRWDGSDNVVGLNKGGMGNVVGLDKDVIRSEELIEMAGKISDDFGILDNGDKGRVVQAELAESKGVGLGNSGIKEVQWSAFSVLQNGVSDSDIFGEFGDGEKIVESLASESNVVYGSDEHKSAYLDGTQSYGQYQESQVNGVEAVYSADGQDMNSTEYWESLYPGWKYDQNTGQWYQVDGYDATTNVEGSFDTNVHNGTTEVSYLQQTSQSGVGTVLQSGTTQSVTNWNQTSHVGEAAEMASNWNQVSQTTESTESVSNWNQVPSSNTEYPSHMYFDPQYPGWYYDTIAQEWRSLDTYIPSTQATVQSKNHLNQNGFTSIGTAQVDDQKTLGVYGQVGNHVATSNTWQPASAVLGFQGNQRSENQYDQTHSLSNQVSQQNSYNYEGSVPSNEKASQSLNEFSTISEHQSFVSGGSFTPQYNQPQFKTTEHMHTSNSYYENQNVSSYSEQQYQNENQFSYASAAGRSSDGRPPHALVSFGFGGKLIIMKDSNSPFGTTNYGGQVPVGGGSISVLNLMEVVSGRPDAINTRQGVCDYFNNLCRQSLPGPLTGGTVSAKELYRWTDERIANCESPDIDYRKGEALRLLLSLLKIALQHYGKLRSPFGTDKVLKETDAPESAVARLFASAKGNGSDSRMYGAPAYCLQNLPSEAKIQATAAEVQTLLVSGRLKEALISAQEGHMWGPALVLAAQLGDQCYVDTVKQMALHQLVPGSPLRTLCLLIAGEPREVFSADSGANGNTQLGANGMLDDWEENLAVITANRTKDDELVLIHLGDCLWKERSEIVAAHICYLVAEANFEPYSDSARLCLVGADHFKFPRTYASPEAIQRTEIYEYSKLLGNSQFTLIPFQPYKLVYAHMLAEVGRVSDSLKYCQAVLKSLKTGRAPEVETWRNLASSLEERIKTHQQGGFSTNLAPAKLVGKLLNLFDSTASRVVGSLPSPATSATAGSIQGNGHYNQSSGPRVSASQSTMAMSSLIPSDSMEPINEWSADGNRMTIHNRSASEPDFSRTPRQDHTDSSKDASSTNAHGKASVSGETSRFGRFGFGSQFIQKILKPRQEKQAKLGETNKFYYDEKLRRWVEEGVDPPAEQAALPPPPTAAAFSNGTSDYNLNSALKNEGPRSNGSQEQGSPTSLAHSSGIPPIPPTSNQFSARGRMGVRSRYVDTFNKGGNQTNMFRSPSVPSVKAKTNACPNFFVPAPVSGQTLDSAADGNQPTASGNPSSIRDSVQSFSPSSSMNMQRFASMDDISNQRTATPGIGNGFHPPHTRRTASWSGSIADSFSPPSDTKAKPLGEVLGMPPSLFMPTSAALVHSSAKGSSYGDDLHEVEL